jgi:hypothetical protein
MGKFAEDAVLIATAVVGLATIAVILSKKADTANVITAAGTALSTDIGAAVKPITG